MGASDERQRIAPHLVLERRLGSGGQGEVWLATDEARGEAVAVKLLRPGPDWRSLARFTQEAQLLGMLDHPGLVRLLAHDLSAERPWLELELVRGRTLRDLLVARIARGEPTDVGWAAIVLDQVCRALAYAHSRGVVHRDLKPTNVLVDDGEIPLVKVIDLGVAKWLAQTDGQATTVSRGFVGTLPFLAPEQVLAQTITERTDVHQLGVLAYTMLALRSPWTGRGEALDQLAPAELGSRILGAPRPRLSRHRPELPAQVEQVLMRAMAISPEARQPTMDVLRVELAAALSGAGPLEAAATLPQRSLDELWAPSPAPAMVGAEAPDTGPVPSTSAPEGPLARPARRVLDPSSQPPPRTARRGRPRAWVWPAVAGIWGLVALVYVARAPLGDGHAREVEVAPRVSTAAPRVATAAPSSSASPAPGPAVAAVASPTSPTPTPWPEPAPDAAATSAGDVSRPALGPSMTARAEPTTAPSVAARASGAAAPTAAGATAGPRGPAPRGPRLTSPRAPTLAEARAAAMAAHDPASVADALATAHVAARGLEPSARGPVEACLRQAVSGPQVATCLDRPVVDELAPWSPWHER